MFDYKRKKIIFPISYICAWNSEGRKIHCKISDSQGVFEINSAAPSFIFFYDTFFSHRLKLFMYTPVYGFNVRYWNAKRYLRVDFTFRIYTEAHPCSIHFYLEKYTIHRVYYDHHINHPLYMLYIENIILAILKIKSRMVYSE